MNSLAFVTHPSVRIKGTENTYTPSQCLDERCPVKAPHMHCPFCVKTDAYQDPVILKAHYRVKHVDKGIEFAGLKILRCCDHCDIVGIIKGEKRFKGAHWHCYRCRNGFNRRDEAIKHYKTHFRNPQTTFQIQITQDLNSPPGVKPLEDSDSLRQEVFSSIENPVQEIIHPALTQAALSLSEHSTNVITSDASKFPKVHVKEEELLKEISSLNSENEQTIMIIQGDPLQTPFTGHVINSAGEVSILNKGGDDPNLSWEIRFRIEEEAKKMFKSQAEEYKNQVELLQQRVTELETQLSQSSELKVQDLLSSLSVGDPDKQILAQQISKYLEELKSSSEEESSEHAINSTSHHLVSADGIVHSFKLDPASSLAQELENSSVDNGMNVVSDSYQVLTSVVDSHRVLINHDHNGIPVSEESGTSLHSHLNGNLVEVTAVESQPESHSKNNLHLFTPVEDVPHSEEMMVLSSSVDHVPASQSLMESAVNMPQGEEHTVLNLGPGHEESVLQVVAAADGLASLGTDVTVVASGNSAESARTFIMEVEGGQQLLVQRGGDDGSLQPLAEDSGSSSELKRPRLS